MDKDKQSQVPEAIASISLTVITPKGFPAIFTVRDTSGLVLLAKVEAIEDTLMNNGYKPQEQRVYKNGGGFAKKEKEYVPDRKCPMCGEALVYSDTAKGRLIKCSTSKWDFATKTATGCKFVEWPKKDDLAL